MSHFIQAGAVRGLTSGLTAGTFVLEHIGLKNLLDLHSSSANVSPLTEFPTPFFVRADKFDGQRKIRIFNSEGKQVYSFERLSTTHPVWGMYTFPARIEVATIFVGLTSRSVDFHNKPGMAHRDISVEIGLGGRYRSFYTTDGAKYSWARGSKFLERVTNPGGGVEEHRQRIAKVKLMRQFKFDFEVLIDEAMIDKEVALSTAFVSMLTQWGIGDVTDSIGPTFISQAPIKREQVDATKQETKVVLVLQGNDDEEITIEA